jgi:hypothetical protein
VSSTGLGATYQPGRLGKPKNTECNDDIQARRHSPGVLVFLLIVNPLQDFLAVFLDLW